MEAGKQLLLLAVFTVVARCQQKPNVLMSPELQQIFTGDLFYLTCGNTNGNAVKWYKDDVEEQTWTDGKVRIAVASRKHSGSYQCESNGLKSDPVSIKVMGYVPTASLSISTGQPVMQRDDSVDLKIENEDGLQGWNCWVNRGKETKKITLNLKDDNVSLTFHTYRLSVPETIYWCTNNTGCRTNQITLRISDKAVFLEMYPQWPVVGESLTLRCLVWDTDQISRSVFYRDDAVIKESDRSTYEIPAVSNSEQGRYKCDATYTYVAQTSEPPSRGVSDNQDVFVQERPVSAMLSENMECSCPSCHENWSERFYQKHDESWVLMSSRPHGDGTFSCRAVWPNMRTSRSASVYVSRANASGILIIILIVAGLVTVIVGAVAFYRRHKRRNATGPIYEDVGMTLREQGDVKYETLQSASGREADYDTLRSEAAGIETKKGEYEQLSKEQMKEGVYHTLGMEGAAGGEGGYEALKKETMKEGVYHTLGMEGAAAGAAAGGGGEGGGRV